MGYLPSLSFRKDKRLLKASDFQQVFDLNTCKISHSKLLILAKLNEEKVSRLGLVVGKKNIPTAVGRNYIKRMVRETFRLMDFPLALDVIFLARKGADKLDHKEMNLLLQQSWCRLRDRCESPKRNNA
ncbi:MAG: ribonuclease P protein component [SAR92 clade bacterium]|uniref:Ribonuclease P protein component n=1 Tax=SAR92 clade bacterium TaxID=2315479 RepID=A0A520MFU7_9GAMM|nr:MAG: ribonuclease P protein component [SAR92 clade bacterium]